MRHSTAYMLFTASAILLVTLIPFHASYRQQVTALQLREHSRLVGSLKLTDLCLFTEARYTRHPAMADFFAPFQDHPGALEHFPSGSFVPPPAVRNHVSKP
jgi:hypothetical protein